MGLHIGKNVRFCIGKVCLMINVESFENWVGNYIWKTRWKYFHRLKLVVMGLNQILCINNMETLENSFSRLEGVLYWKMFYLELYHSFELFILQYLFTMLMVSFYYWNQLFEVLYFWNFFLCIDNSDGD